MYSTVAFLIALTLLIGFHEFGHFLVARYFGIKVLRFSIGFGPVIWSWWDKRGTEFALSAIPLGGYVKMQEDADTDHDKNQVLNAHPIWHRVLVVLGGPGANFLLALAFFLIIFMSGVTGLKPVVGEVGKGTPAYEAGFKPDDVILTVQGTPTSTWHEVLESLLPNLGDTAPVAVTVLRNQNQVELILDDFGSQISSPRVDLISQLGVAPYLVSTLKIKELLPNKPAKIAGLKKGDSLLAVNGLPIENAKQLVDWLQQNKSAPIQLNILRDEVKQSITLNPKQDLETKKYSLGIVMVGAVDKELLVKKHYSLLPALARSYEKVLAYSKLTLQFMWRMLTGQLSTKHLSGPISIAQGAGVSAHAGVKPFLSFMALISISLGVLNLLPIPMLDGGHLLFYGYEAIKGEPMSVSAREQGFKIGLAILLVLTSIALYNDFAHLGFGS